MAPTDLSIHCEVSLQSIFFEISELKYLIQTDITSLPGSEPSTGLPPGSRAPPKTETASLPALPDDSDEEMQVHPDIQGDGMHI